MHQKCDLCDGFIIVLPSYTAICNFTHVMIETSARRVLVKCCRLKMSSNWLHIDRAKRSKMNKDECYQHVSYEQSARILDSVCLDSAVDAMGVE